MDHLHRTLGAGGERGAQGLVAADDLAQARLQSGHLQPPLNLNGGWNVVQRAPRLQPVEEPETLLREGDRQRPSRARLARDAVRVRPAGRRSAFPLEPPEQHVPLLRREVLESTGGISHEAPPRRARSPALPPTAIRSPPTGERSRPPPPDRPAPPPPLRPQRPPWA